jgi:hypothetical protein
MTDQDLAVTLTDRFDRATTHAREGFARKARKQVAGDASPAVPYLCHLLEVAGIVLDHGGDEDAAIAGLLHDAAEDLGGEPELEKIEVGFGAAVRLIVQDLSDDTPAPGTPKADWWIRKVRYIDHLRSVEAPTLLVCAADKLSNVRASRASFRQFGDDAFSLSKHGGRAGTLWYYDAVISVLEDRGFDPNGLVTTLRVEYQDWITAVRDALGDQVVDGDLAAAEKRASDARRNVLDA